jgi:predicted glutamine amidotransferase
MCGHVGVAGVLRYDEEKIFKKMLHFDYFRGMDSTGMAAVKLNDEVAGVKVADHPLILFDLNKFKNTLNYNVSKVFMGHNRAATRGGISNSNAHPFNFDHITGTHNGTLTTKSTKALEDALGETFPVDSAALFAAIAKLGIEKTISLCETGNTSYEGAWSLVWYDATQGTLNFLRNKWRPMWFAYSEDNKRLFWASEWPIIQAAIHVADDNPQGLSKDKEGYSYFPAEVDVLYSFDLAVLREGKTRPKPKIKKLAGKEPTPVVTTTWQQKKDDPFDRNETIGMGFHSSTTMEKERRGKDVVHLIGDNDNPLAGTIRKADFERFAKHGCAWCQTEVNFTDKGLLIVERDEAVLCKECAGDVDVTRVYATPDLMTVLANV